MEAERQQVTSGHQWHSIQSSYLSAIDSDCATMQDVLSTQCYRHRVFVFPVCQLLPALSLSYQTSQFYPNRTTIDDTRVSRPTDRQVTCRSIVFSLTCGASNVVPTKCHFTLGVKSPIGGKLQVNLAHSTQLFWSSFLVAIPK